METMTTPKLYVFEEHPKKKGHCPNCNTKEVFRYYEGLPKEYGKCDRENNCGYQNKPNGFINDYVPPVPKPEPKIIYPSEQFCAGILT